MPAVLLTEEDLASHNMDVMVHAVDGDGYYLGLVPASTPDVTQVPGPPPTPGMKLIAGVWTVVLTLEQVRTNAMNMIDVKAGQVRLRFITEVPGQQGTYMLKAAEARAYVASGYTGTVPPFVAAEAAALGGTAAAAADTIVATADQWEGVIGPAIEQERIKGKHGVQWAVDETEIQTYLDGAIAALDAITP